MDHTTGRPEIVVGLLDGPVAGDHPELATESIREMPGSSRSSCTDDDSFACLHGTFVAGILTARRGSPAPAICPGCTLLVRPIFGPTAAGEGPLPGATAEELAAALLECVAAGVHVVNLSASLTEPSPGRHRVLEEALDHALQHGVLVVAAVGNEGTIGGSLLTRHPGVLPVVAYTREGRPMDLSNLSGSAGRRGVGAPGEAITSLSAGGETLRLDGTSVAAPFVTGTLALLRSEFPAASAAEVKAAVVQASGSRRTTIVPPLLDAWMAYRVLKKEA